jgi:Zn-dependent peptidase ImmA (M78 family)
MKILANNPVKAAKELHELLGWTQPSDYTLEEISNSLGVIIKDIPIKGSEGRILIKENTGIISINSAITYSPKRNFIIAHELGHFILHKNITHLFSDTQKTLADWYKNGLHEQQANEFASELLLPTELFKRKVDGKKLNMTLIEEVADYFGASLTATFLKYATAGKYPVMIIFIEEGVIRWKQCSNDFPFKFLQINSNVPAWTVAGDFFNGKALEAKPEKVDAIEWFPEDFEIENKKDWKLWEQCFQVSENGLISCLWTY